MFIEFFNGVHFVHDGSIVQVFGVSKYPRLCIVSGFVGDFISLKLLHPHKNETSSLFKSAHGFSSDLFVKQGI